MFRVMIVDDEPFARQEMNILLEESNLCEVVCECSNAIEAFKALHKHRPDIIFLDIQMPKITGLDFVAMLDESDRPHIVFVTAYDDFAVEAFENYAIDYLLKPVSPQRLHKTLERIYQLEKTQKTPLKNPSIQSIVPEMLSSIPCSIQNRIRLVRINELECAFTDLTGVQICTRDGDVFHCQLTLKVLEDKTPLIRCHRQHLIHPDSILEITQQENGTGHITTRANHSVPISRRYLKTLKESLGMRS